ncbi:MAG: PKD domain-containing protein [Phycisphaerales bacterium]|nr:PKD domain-containing protein [Phycisphaerales bacterium]
MHFTLEFSASFTIPKYNPACIDDAVVEFTNTSTVSEPAWNAHWTFGDGSDNNLWSPWKIYADAIGNYLVTLTITDLYGCSDSVTATVDVRSNNLDGYLDSSSSLACSGSPITLTYDPTPGPGMPTTFKWHESTNFLEENTSSTRVVYEPGAYWVWGKDAIGCSDKTATTIVDFNRVPEALISADTSVCEGTLYRVFYPAAAFDPSATYTWYENGVPSFSGSTPYFDFSNIAGSYTYRLVISVTLSGVTCTDTSDPITVVVHPYPVNPTPAFNILSCAEYKVELTATSSSVGTFNWSSGDVGTPVYVYTGGPYRVWLTDEFGCMSYSDIDVPHKPDVYQYVFPVGCYELCENEAPFDLLGPKAPASFDYWEWLMNGSMVSKGTGTVTTYSVTAPGTYNLVLENTPCIDTSGDLNISFKDCPGGCFGGIQFISATQTMAGGGMCYDTVELGIGCAPFVTYTIYCDNGTLLPATGIGPSPIKKFRYIADPGFTGPIDFITAIFYNPMTGQSCRARIPLPIGTPCPNSMARRTEDTTIDNGNVVANELARLTMMPNPAQSTVRIEFGFTGKSDQRSIEVYDMAGRKMLSESVQERYGTAILNLDGFSSGLYQVILRQDGNVFLHGKLSVVK